MAKVDTALLTQAEYARHRKALGLSGGTRESVRKKVDKGSISVFGDKGLIDPALADVQWERNTRARLSPQAQGVAKPDLVGQAGAVQLDAPRAETQPAAITPVESPNGYTAARARRENADATTAEMQLAKLRGELVSRADVDRAGFEIGREIRDAMESSVNTLAAELAPITSAEACADLLRKHNRALQEVLVRAYREKIGAPPAGLA
jgi:hypothetical protein